MLNRYLRHLLYGEGLLYDDVAITAGVGTVVAAHTVGGRNFQVVESLPSSGKAPVLSSVAINVAAGGDTDLVALVAGQYIRVMGLELVANGGAVNVILKDGTTPTNFSPAIPLADKGNWFLPRDGEPWFQTAISAKLTINLSVAIQVSGRLYYSQGV